MSVNAFAVTHPTTSWFATARKRASASWQNGPGFGARQKSRMCRTAPSYGPQPFRLGLFEGNGARDYSEQRLGDLQLFSPRIRELCNNLSVARDVNVLCLRESRYLPRFNLNSVAENDVGRCAGSQASWAINSRRLAAKAAANYLGKSA